MSTYTLADMLSDANGAVPFTDDVAAIGTIDSAYYLRYTSEKDIPAEWGTQRDLGEEAYQKLFFVNYNALLGAGEREEDAVFGASLRVRMMREGFVSLDLPTRAIYVDEYMLVAEPKRQAIDEFRPNPTWRNIIKFVNTYFFGIVGVVAHVFRVRGHHFRDDYAPLYERTWRATTIEASFGMPSWRTISRDHLHCFGIKALHESLERGLRNGQAPEGLRVRQWAAPAGSAPLRTASAALHEMESAPWYKTFHDFFREEVTSIHDAAIAIRDLGVRAHINAKLYNWKDSRIIHDEGPLKSLVPYILGWISTLDPLEPIAQQKCLNKRATGGLSLKNNFSMLLVNIQRAERTAQSIQAFLEAQR